MPDGKEGLKLAAQMQADVVLLQNGVYFAQSKWLEDFSGKKYVLEQDLKLRGLSEISAAIKKIDYDSLVGLMSDSDKVVGMF